MIDELPRTTERECPKCGTDAVAWVSSDGNEEMFECRRCKTVFKCVEP